MEAPGMVERALVDQIARAEVCRPRTRRAAVLLEACRGGLGLADVAGVGHTDDGVVIERVPVVDDPGGGIQRPRRLLAEQQGVRGAVNDVRHAYRLGPEAAINLALDDPFRGVRADG